MLQPYQRHFSGYQAKEWLRGLKGKAREKMLFALEQADLELLHAYALHHDMIRSEDFPSKIDPVLQVYNNKLNALYEQFKVIDQETRAALTNALGPKHGGVVSSCFFGNVSYPSFSTPRNYILQKLENAHLREDEIALERKLQELREELLTPSGVSKHLLTPEDKSEITARIQATKALPPGEPVEVPYEDSKEEVR